MQFSRFLNVFHNKIGMCARFVMIFLFFSMKPQNGWFKANLEAHFDAYKYADVGVVFRFRMDD